MLALLLATAAAALLLALAASAQAATLTVTSTADSGAGSLRDTIAAASPGDTITFAVTGTIDLTSGAITIPVDLTIQGPGASELTIDAGANSGIFTLAPTVTSLGVSGLTLQNGLAASGGAIHYQATVDASLSITDSVLEGNGSTSSTGGGGAIALDTSGSASLSITDSTLRDNHASGDSLSGGGAILFVAGGTATLKITGSAFDRNAAGGPGGSGAYSGAGVGGAIDASGGAYAGANSLTIAGSTFHDNSAGGAGGSGFASGSGTGGALDDNLISAPLKITDSTFDGNSAGGAAGTAQDSGQATGGAIWYFASGGPNTISDSTFTANRTGGDAGAGAGAYSGTGGGSAILYASYDYSLTVIDSTLADNSAGGTGGSGTDSGAGQGAAIGADTGAITLASDTIDGNSVGPASNSSGSAIDTPSGVTAQATIVADNTGAANCSTPAVSSSFSMEGPASSTSCGFDLPSADPLLGPLADNGGPTQTQALAANSPAVDAVPAASCPTSTDQRGLPRPDAGEAFCDVGAYELQDPRSTDTMVRCQPATIAPGDSTTCTATVTDTTAGTPVAPQGTAALTATSGTITGSPCTLTATMTAGVSSCQVTYASTLATGNPEIDATYTPTDSIHTQSSGHTTVTVAIPPRTPGCRIFGTGILTTQTGDWAAFDLPASFTDLGPHTIFWLAAPHIKSITCTNTAASIYGTAWINGQHTLLRTDVTAGGPFTPLPTYRLRTATGYDTATQTVRFGLIRIQTP